jgi:hypothetical protein
MRAQRTVGARLREIGMVMAVAAAIVCAWQFAGAVVAGGGVARGASANQVNARRVLVFAMPYVSWADLERVRLPNLDRFTAEAAVAGLSTRVHARRTPLADGYATIGAGTRTVGTPETDGDGLMRGESFGTVTAADVYRQRTGRAAQGAIVQTGIVAILDANARLDYDTEVGALADTLARGGFSTAVIANADGREPDAARSPSDATAGPARQRQAVLGLMDSRGQVQGGRVDRGLLVPDRDAPFGVRLDDAAVLDVFHEAWRGRAVVLVEASDLVRVGRYAPYVTPAQHDRQRDAALRRADRLLGALLAEVDPTRDLVMVVGPAHAPDRVTLAPLAVRGPGYGPGLLRSATTRRSGFVQIHDVAPTILAAVGLERPDSMEGRAAEVGDRGGGVADRLEFLRHEDAAAQFRDARIGEVYALLTAAATAIVGLGLLARRGSPRSRGLARFAALWGLGLLSSAFLVRLAPLHEAGPAAFYLALVGLGALVAAMAAIVARRDELDGLLVALAVIVVVLGIDAVRGAPLVLNSVLGYSPTVAGRFAGFGNPAYAAFSSSALFAAVLLAHRSSARRGRRAAAVVLGVALVIDVAPMWGADVGGILTMVPAYALTMMILLERRVRARAVALAAGAVIAAVALAALVDVARPEDERTHLGRFVERVRDNGIAEGWSVVERKLAANLATVGSSILGLVVLVAVVGLVVAWSRERSRLRAVITAVPEMRAGVVGFAVLAPLGFALNDSGMTVPGIMLVVFLAVWVYLSCTVAPGPAADDTGARGGHEAGPPLADVVEVGG